MSPPDNGTPARVGVLDTSVLYARSQPFEIDEIRRLAPAELVVPYTVLAELDILTQRTVEGVRARSALNVLKDFVRRGAAVTPVSCGEGLSLRIARAVDEQVVLPQLDPGLADDRILACALAQRRDEQAVVLATTEFALHAKALSIGLEGLYLEQLADAEVTVTRRERAGFRDRWQRLQVSFDSWTVCRRAIMFLNSPLASRILAVVRQSGEPAGVYKVVAGFDALSRAWTETTSLDTVLFASIGLHPSPRVDYGTVIIDEPASFGIPHIPASSRRETAEERSIRIRAAEEARQAREAFIVDTVLDWMAVLKDYILDQVGEDLEP
jgi:hypothetical protein